MEKILIIDDDVDMCMLLEKLLTRHGYQVIQMHTGVAALKFLENNQPALVICDLLLGDIDGINILKKVKEKNAAMPFLMITAYDDIQISMDAIKRGALDYITKPILPEEILMIVQNALKKDEAFDFTPAGNTLQQTGPHFFGKSEYFKKLNTEINLVAPTDYNIILAGETGSGKKILAKEIHRRSRRSSMPFVMVTSEELSVINTAEKPVEDSLQFFVQANGGTVLLHNVAAIPAAVQEAMLKIIKKKSIKKAGSSSQTDLDVRILISSTDALWNTVISDAPGHDLFYLLNDYNIDLLPLRFRKDDILLFANHFLYEANKELRKTVQSLSASAEDIFRNYKWPGNLHELKNVVTRSVLLTDGTLLTADVLPAELRKYAGLAGTSG
jgi:two-component system, NtrC family, response regulator HydG